MPNSLWNDVLNRLEKRINRPSFNTWIRPTCLVSITQQHIHIGVPDDVFVYWLGEYYVNVIADTLAEILGFQTEISFVVMDDHGNSPPPGEIPASVRAVTSNSQTVHVLANTAEAVHATAVGAQADLFSAPLPRRDLYGDDAPKEPPHRKPEIVSAVREQGSHRQKEHSVRSSSPASPARNPDSETPATLNPRYMFTSYVVGNNNRFAHAAALAVADQMAGNYNPLFIYGGVGLGKTHLLHAIGNHVLASNYAARVLYLSAEQFINDMITSIRGDRMARFREKYRKIDLFLVDDIQFIARKERTQEEFFHTFNTLYHDRKQIVLTSDCPPKKIPTIAEQLRSRFEWGLIADIQPPDLETRIAILKKKAEVQQMVLPDEVAIYIASKVKSNIRQLEGCLSKIRAFSLFNMQVVTLELAQRVLHDMFDLTPKRLTVDLIQQTVANHYQIDLASLSSQSRSRDVALPRQIAMYLARELTNLSLPEIGRNFGGRDHTTVLHACKKVEQLQAKDQRIQESLRHLKELLQR